jgi:hypothetical protein
VQARHAGLGIQEQQARLADLVSGPSFGAPAEIHLAVGQGARRVEPELPERVGITLRAAQPIHDAQRDFRVRRALGRDAVGDALDAAGNDGLGMVDEVDDVHLPHGCGAGRDGSAQQCQQRGDARAAAERIHG